MTTQASLLINGAIWPDAISATENYTDPGSGLVTTVSWSDSDGGGFEQYGISGTNVRGTDDSYDHDNNPLTPDITVSRGVEVNDDSGNVTLTASFVLDPSLTSEPVMVLNFGADTRGGFGGGNVEIFNVTDGRFILPNTLVNYGPGSNPDWLRNDFEAMVFPSDLGDTIELRFNDPNTGAQGLQLTAVTLAVVPVPEPATGGILMLLSTFLLGFRRRRSLS